MMTENMINMSENKISKQITKNKIQSLYEKKNETYRVTVAVVGFCCFPTVGIPLFLP